MAKPKTKTELIKAATDQYDKLYKVINTLSETEQNAVFCFDADKMGAEAHWKRDKNLRDALVHVYEWQQLLLKWEKANSVGDNKPFLPSPFTWKSYAQMNVEFWEKHQGTSLKEAKELLENSHKHTILLIEKYTDEQLFTKAFFKWTGTTSLAQYCTSCTSSHYDWVTKKMNQQIKALKN